MYLLIYPFTFWNILMEQSEWVRYLLREYKKYLFIHIEKKKKSCIQVYPFQNHQEKNTMTFFWYFRQWVTLVRLWDWPGYVVQWPSSKMSPALKEFSLQNVIVYFKTDNYNWRKEYKNWSLSLCWLKHGDLATVF